MSCPILIVAGAEGREAASPFGSYLAPLARLSAESIDFRYRIDTLNA